MVKIFVDIPPGDSTFSLFEHLEDKIHAGYGVSFVKPLETSKEVVFLAEMSPFKISRLYLASGPVVSNRTTGEQQQPFSKVYGRQTYL